MQDGDIAIFIDNAQTQHSIDQPITGKIKVARSELLANSTLTLELHGYETSSYFDESKG